MANKFSHKYVFSFLIFFGVIFLDQITKYLFTSTCNPGMAFSLLMPFGRFNIVFSFAILLGVFYLLVKQKQRRQYVPLVLILSGGVSNLLDRIIFGCVRDFINFTIWPSFNLADSAVTVGVLTLSFVILTKVEAKKINDSDD